MQPLISYLTEAGTYFRITRMRSELIESETYFRFNLMRSKLITTYATTYKVVLKLTLCSNLLFATTYQVVPRYLSRVPWLHLRCVRTLAPYGGELAASSPPLRGAFGRPAGALRAPCRLGAQDGLTADLEGSLVSVSLCLCVSVSLCLCG